MLDAVAVVNPATAAVHANVLDGTTDAKRKTGQSKTRRMPRAFAAHRRPGGRMSPAGRYRRVVLAIGDAPWHWRRSIRSSLSDDQTVRRQVKSVLQGRPKRKTAK